MSDDLTLKERWEQFKAVWWDERPPAVETVLHADDGLPKYLEGTGWQRVWDEATNDWCWQRPYTRK